MATSPEVLRSPVGCVVPPAQRYYDLICASRRLLPIYALDDRSLPRGQPREGPHFYLHVCPNVPPSVPRQTEWVHLAVASPPVQALPYPYRLGICVPHVFQSHVAAFRGCKVRLMLRPLVGSPCTGQDLYARAFTSGVTSLRRRVCYAGSQPIPAAGLAPATHAALWAARGTNGPTIQSVALLQTTTRGITAIRPCDPRWIAVLPRYSRE
jgi:hypothetical protein